MRRAVAGPAVVADPAAADKVPVVVVNPAAVVVVAASPAVVVAAARVVAARAAVVVDAHRAAADKVVGVNPVAAVHRAVVVAGWEEEAVVAVRLEVGAAESLNSSQSSGASRSRGAPFFY